MSEQPIIDIQDLNFFYENFLALKDINLKITSNRITTIIGPSGCGKSSLLGCINRLNDFIPGAKTTGKILYYDKDVYDHDVDPILLRRKIGIVFQQPNPFPKSIYYNVAYGPRMYGLKNKPILNEIVINNLHKVGLYKEVKENLQRPAQSLSLGQQQRLCIARTLASGPDVILMDEPTSALDPASTMRIEDLMSEISKKYTIIMVTHNIQQASRVSDFTAFMITDKDKAGYIIEKGPTMELFMTPKRKETEEYVSGRFGG